jgi:hypothetical protein
MILEPKPYWYADTSEKRIARLSAWIRQIALSSARIYGTGLELKHNKAGVSIVGSGCAETHPSKPPSYTTHAGPKPNWHEIRRFPSDFQGPNATLRTAQKARRFTGRLTLTPDNLIPGSIGHR